MWLSTLLDKIFCFVPRPLIVAPDEGGYRASPRLRGGLKVRELKPGWYFWLPILQRQMVIGVKTQPKDVKTQSLWTSDGHNVLVSVVIRYRIVDPVKACLEVYNYDDSIQTITLGVVSSFVMSHTLAECKTRTRELTDQVLADLRKESQGWGLRMQSVGITDIGDVWNLRIVTNNEQARSSTSI